MKIDKDLGQSLVAVAIFAWLLLVILGGSVVLENVSLGARLNALETVCKANLLAEKEK